MIWKSQSDSASARQTSSLEFRSREPINTSAFTDEARSAHSLMIAPNSAGVFTDCGRKSKFQSRPYRDRHESPRDADAIPPWLETLRGGLDLEPYRRPVQGGSPRAQDAFL